MLNTITTLYKNMRHKMELKEKYKTIFDGLLRYLYDFLSQGKRWALKSAYNASQGLPGYKNDEYLYRIHVKCGWANNLIHSTTTVRDRLIEYCGDKSKTMEYIDRAFIVLKSTRELLVSSVQVIPYTKMDEFNDYVYQTEQDLHAIIQSGI